MREITDQQLSGVRLVRVEAEHVDGDDLGLRRSVLRDVGIDDVTVRGISLHDVRLRGAWLRGVEVDGEVEGLTVNGVDVGPLVDAELVRRYPDLAAMRPSDPDGFRHAWDVVEGLWAGTLERARSFDPDQLHESVGGEWSFIETLRHLAFATECWLYRAILGEPAPWDALSLPWDEMPDTPGVPRDREVRPDLETVLALRLDRMAAVRQYLDGLTDQVLAGETTPVDAPGWPEPRAYPVRECLLTILNEEWWHRRFAERDLDALEQRS